MNGLSTTTLIVTKRPIFGRTTTIRSITYNNYSFFICLIRLVIQAKKFPAWCVILFWVLIEFSCASKSALRQELYRQRKKRELQCIQVEIRNAETQTLIRRGHLVPSEASTVTAIRSALYKHLDPWSHVGGIRKMIEDKNCKLGGMKTAWNYRIVFRLIHSHSY